MCKKIHARSRVRRLSMFLLGLTSPRRMSLRCLASWCVISALLCGCIPALEAQQSSASSPSTPPPAPVPVPPEPIHIRDYSRPRSAFPNLLQPYKAQDLPHSNLGNSPRIDALMRDGKIYLSIDDAVALALENNLDIDIARYNLNIADADL